MLIIFWWAGGAKRIILNSGIPFNPYFAFELEHLEMEFITLQEGAQWLSGRVLDSRPRGRGFEPHLRHCVVVLEQDTFILA